MSESPSPDQTADSADDHTGEADEGGGPGEGGDTGLTTGSLARRLGVAPTTLRSWDRR